MIVPEIQNDLYFTGNSEHLDKFHPLFQGKSGKIDPQTPHFYKFEDIFRVAPYSWGNKEIFSGNAPFFYISRTNGLKIHTF